MDKLVFPTTSLLISTAAHLLGTQYLLGTKKNMKMMERSLSKQIEDINTGLGTQIAALDLALGNKIDVVNEVTKEWNSIKERFVMKGELDKTNVRVTNIEDQMGQYHGKTAERVVMA